MPIGEINPEEVEEAMAEKEVPEEIKKIEENNLPEAPASATIRFWIDDFSVLLTMRDTKMFPLVDKVQKLIAVAQAKGWKSSWKKEGEISPEEVLAQPVTKITQDECPVDHSTLKPMQVKKIGKNTGRWFVGCNKCDYFKWVEF